MYISGHKELLFDALSKLKDTSLIDIESLETGMVYPDLPCGDYSFKKNNVVLETKKLCNTFQLYKLFNRNNQMKELYQSHRGINAFFHSMACQDTQTVEEILEELRWHIASCAWLSMFDTNSNENTNSFWIGMLLHTMTDSYSRSHTIRLSEKETNYPTPSIRDPSLLKVKQVILNLITDIIQETPMTKEKELIQEVKKRIKISVFHNDPDILQFIQKKGRDIYKTYKLMLFKQQVRKEVQEIVPKIPICQKRQKYDISNFQYIWFQDGMYHKKYDLMLYVKKHPALHRRLLRECSTVLKMYANVITKLKNENDKIEFVKELTKYVMNSTFRVHQKNLKNRVGVVYSLSASQTKKTGK